MIGPPGLPKFPRRVFSFQAAGPVAARRPAPVWVWLTGLYFAGVLAHFSHQLAFDLSAGRTPTFGEALASDAVSLVWPADLIGTLIGPGPG